MKLVSFALAAMLGSAAVANAHAADAAPLPAAITAYDRTASFEVQQIGVEKRGDVEVRDITFRGAPENSPIKANMIKPAGKGPFAAVLYVHWLGEEHSDRTQFLDEAVAFAKRGVASLLIDTMWSQPRWYGKRVPEQDYDISVRQVVDIRRAMDLLYSQSYVDKERVAYVGHDFGAMYGMLAMAADQRPVAYVFLAPTTSFVDWFLYGPKPKDLAAYKAQIEPLDPLKHIAALSGKKVFLQFADTDEYVPHEKQMQFFAALGAQKMMASYPVGHHMRNEDAKDDRLHFLARELKLK